MSEARPSARARRPNQRLLTGGLLKHHSGVATSNGIETGNQTALAPEPENRSSLIVASYNIRYGVGSHLISSGLSRRVGYNFPQPRAEAVARNIQTAARSFSNNVLLPPPDILATEIADDLESALEQFSKIAARLKSTAT